MAIKIIAEKNWQFFFKTVIFGNIFLIWHHLATLAAHGITLVIVVVA